MNTRIVRFVTVVVGLAAVAVPAVLADPGFRHYVADHPAVAAYIALATPIVLAAYREFVAWKKPAPPAK